MNHWFLYTLADGKIYGLPYRGQADEWTNIPEGCGVIGPFQEDETVKDAFENADLYTVQNGALVPVSDIGERKAVQEAERQQQRALPTIADRLDNMEAVINEILMGGV